MVIAFAAAVASISIRWAAVIGLAWLLFVEPTWVGALVGAGLGVVWAVFSQVVFIVGRLQGWIRHAPNGGFAPWYPAVVKSYNRWRLRLAGLS